MSSFIASILMPIYLLLGLVSPTSVGSLTTINGSDRMTDSRAVINANFTDLDTRKVETTATTLPSSFLASSLTSVGTLTSGALGTGFTAVPVSLGGTGTTSPTSNYVMLGNGSQGLKTVSGQGTSGQFLTSNGAGQAPTFQTSAVALGDNYAWTGTHSFDQFNGGYGGMSPVGSITAYATTTAPTGWKLADGTAISRTTYANLFAVIGTSYGVGDNSTTFNLPNLSGRTIIMATSTQTYADVLGETGGATSTVLTLEQIPAHTHTYGAEGAGGTTQGLKVSSVGTQTQSSSSGGGLEHSNLDPYIVLNYIIKY